VTAFSPLGAGVAEYGLAPPPSLGNGPRRDPPLWARATRFLARHVVERAGAFYEGADPDDVWPLGVAVVCRNGEVAYLHVGNADRASWEPRLKAAFRTAKVVRYAIAMESWMSLPEGEVTADVLTDPEAADRMLRESMAPVDDPNRREALMVHASERRGRDEVLAHELVRGEDGRIASLRDITETVAPGGARATAVGSLARLF
jgi:hypothetical protein